MNNNIKRRCQWFSKKGLTKKSPMVQCERDAIDGNYCCMDHSFAQGSEYDGNQEYCIKCRNPKPCKCIDICVTKEKHTNKKIKR